MAVIEDQQFCLRWNNFQANFTSQFETLRDDEDFTDVTIACEGQKLQAHKVVLSACSPYFKELFKTNPCSHPIIFMRDVEAQHIIALMEFMYAGEVNVAQANLSAFLKTAESLKIRGLTDSSYESDLPKEEDTLYLNHKPSKCATNKQTSNKQHISSSSTVTSSQDPPKEMSPSPSPPPKRPCKSESELSHLSEMREESMNVNPFAIHSEVRSQLESALQPKLELPDYLSDEEVREDISNFYGGSDLTELPGGMEMIPQTSSFDAKGATQDIALHSSSRFRRRYSPQSWPKENLPESTNSPSYSWRQGDTKNRLIKIGEGIEICEDQLRSVKWSDYRKLTRGLATILFSSAELATCSVTGQRWSRAGSVERPVKPALDRAKVQAIISYVATRFPLVEISRIKQVLAYKCKENSTAFKMKAVRYYGNQLHK